MTSSAPYFQPSRGRGRWTSIAPKVSGACSSWGTLLACRAQDHRPPRAFVAILILAAVLQNVLFASSTLAGEVAALAELPHWPYGLPVPDNLPPPKKPVKGAAMLVWVPPQAERIRAVLMIRQNTDSKIFGEHAAVRKVAARHQMGIIYFRYYDHGALSRDPDDPVIFRLLDAVARKTGIEEFRHAPWITFGKSSVGKFPFYLAWAFPQRTIATISYHAETPTWPPESWARLGDETILHVSLNGETEWGGTWNRHVRPSLLNYRARSRWLPHLAVVYDVGHGNYVDVHGGPGWGRPFPGKVTCIRAWDYLALYVDKALQLRLPKDRVPTRGPIELTPVDESAGYLIRPYAIEDMFRLPRIPLVRSEDGYVVDPGGDDPPSTFAAIAPARDFTPPEGVPVEPLPLGRSPSRWLLAGPLEFAMQNDPMRTLGGWESLRPKPGDRVAIDSRQATFQAIDPRHVRREGGIALNRGLQRTDKATLLAYTVLDVPKPTPVKINAPFTQNGRVQVVLSGVPVAHRQVVQLEKGLYPMLVVVRLRTRWATLMTGFEPAAAREVQEARQYTAELQRKAAEDQQASGRRSVPTDAPVIRKASEVPEAERRNMFWVADRELADAWFKLHAVHGQRQ